SFAMSLATTAAIRPSSASFGCSGPAVVRDPEIRDRPWRADPGRLREVGERQAPNLGLRIKSDNEAQVNYDFTVLASNDYSPVPGVRPQLQVTYSDCTLRWTPLTVTNVSGQAGNAASTR